MAFQPGSDAWHSGLPKLGAVTALYAVCVVAACIPVGSALDGLDAFLPFAFFPHLQDGGADGPIGDPMRLATGVWLRLLGFRSAFAPVALRLRTPAGLLVPLAIFDEPDVFATMVWLRRLVGSADVG